MENTNTLKLCKTKKSTIISQLVSIMICGIICLVLLPLPILPFMPFSEVHTSKIFLLIMFTIFDLLMGIPLVYLGIIVKCKIIKQRLKVNKLLDDYFCEYSKETQTFIIKVGKHKTQFKLSEIKKIDITPKKHIDYLLYDIKIEYDKIKELCITLKNKDEILLPIPYLKNVENDIKSIRLLLSSKEDKGE